MSDELGYPSDWYIPHKVTHKNVSRSGFSFGYDAEGDPIIIHDSTGDAFCFAAEFMRESLAKANAQKTAGDESVEKIAEHIVESHKNIDERLTEIEERLDRVERDIDIIDGGI